MPFTPSQAALPISMLSTYSYSSNPPFSDTSCTFLPVSFTLFLLVSCQVGLQGPHLSGSLLLVGKLEHWKVDAFSLPAGSTRSSLIYLHDEFTGRRGLLDTRASVSVFPAPTSSAFSGISLLTADGSSVSCSGSRIIPLHFGSWNCSWMFQLAPVSVPILVADFLQHHDLIVSAKQNMFSSSTSNGSVINLCSFPPPPIQKTTIITPFGVFEFLVMTFDLQNASNTFQCSMNQILGDLTFCFDYADNILIFSKDISFQVEHLQHNFLLCLEYGLTIGLPKCQFA